MGVWALESLFLHSLITPSGSNRPSIRWEDPPVPRLPSLSIRRDVMNGNYPAVTTRYLEAPIWEIFQNSVLGVVGV